MRRFSCLVRLVAMVTASLMVLVSACDDADSDQGDTTGASPDGQETSDVGSSGAPHTFDLTTLPSEQIIVALFSTGGTSDLESTFYSSYRGNNGIYVYADGTVITFDDEAMDDAPYLRTFSTGTLSDEQIDDILSYVVPDDLEAAASHQGSWCGVPDAGQEVLYVALDEVSAAVSTFQQFSDHPTCLEADDDPGPATSVLLLATALTLAKATATTPLSTFDGFVLGACTAECCMVSECEAAGAGTLPDGYYIADSASCFSNQWPSQWSVMPVDSDSEATIVDLVAGSHVTDAKGYLPLSIATIDGQCRVLVLEPILPGEDAVLAHTEPCYSMQ